jgi:hypothetical protein
MNKSSRFNPYKMFNGSVIPEAVCRVPVAKLSYPAKITYGRLIRYAGENGYAFPKQEKIAQEIGAETRSVKRYLKDLVVFGLIEAAQRGKKRSNVYFFLWHPIFDMKSEVPKQAPRDVPIQALPYEESHYKRVKNGNAKGVSDSSQSHSKGMNDIVPTDEDGNELPRRAKKVPGADGKNKIALRLQHRFSDMCFKQVGTRPMMTGVGYKMILYAMNTGKLTEAQVEDLFEEWFSLGHSDEDSIQITRAVSPNQINNYKVRNNIGS